MKFTVHHSDPEVLAAMAQLLAKEFRPELLILDPESVSAESDHSEASPETSGAPAPSKPFRSFY